MICVKCKTAKDSSEFPKDASRKSGYKSSCKICYSLNRKSRANNKTAKEYSEKYYKENREKLSQRYFTRNYRDRQLERYYSKREHILEKRRYYLQTPQGKFKNCEKESRRRSRKLGATPTWLSQNQLSQIEYLYWLSKDLELTSGQKYHVDHIVPLQGRHVCGLHVPWNLQVIPAEINLSKGNRYDY